MYLGTLSQKSDPRLHVFCLTSLTNFTFAGEVRQMFYDVVNSAEIKLLLDLSDMPIAII